MKIETKFNVGETVYFISDNVLNKGVIKEIIINVMSSIFEKYEVKYINYCYEEVTDVIEGVYLFKNTRDLFDKLILDFENSEK